MKKMYLIIIALFITQYAQSQSWPFIGGAGQGMNPQNMIHTADILPIADNDVYTAVFQTDIGGNDKSLKVYHYDGGAWQTHSTLSTDAVIGSVYFRKSKAGTVFIAYAKISPQFNYFIYVKKLVNGKFVSVGDSLGLTSGIKYFGFDVDHKDNPYVLGSKSSILDPTRISKNVNGVWSHYTIPNATGVTIEENNTMVDDQNNLIFMYVKSALVGGALANIIMVDTLFSDLTFSTGTESITAKYPSFTNLVYDANNKPTIINREGLGSSTLFRTYTLANGQWNQSAADTLTFPFSTHLAMSASGKIIAASLDAKISIGPMFNTLLSQSNTGTICYKLKCNGEKGYAVYSTGIVSGDLNVSIGMNKKSTVDLAVYPNPTTNTFYLNTNEAIQTIRVYSQDGRLLLQENAQESISLEALQNGYYLVEVIFENGEIGRAKVMKQ